MNSEYYFYKAQNGVQLLKNKKFDSYPELAYGFSTRIGGVSTGECESLNLSWQRRDSEENVKENHLRLADALGIDYKDIAFVKLMHGDKVLFADSGNRNNGRWWENMVIGYDAVITDRPNVAILARTADCGNLLMYDRHRHVISAVHSGWKGTAAGIICNAVNAMKSRYGCNPDDIEAVFGSSICPDCFLVHDDCADVFREKYGSGKYDSPVPDGRYSIDLWRLMNDQLLSCGIAPENIQTPGLCSCCDREHFFSHRRGRGRSGIMYAIIELKE